MKDNKKIRKLLYLSKSNIALIVLEEHNIIYANQVDTDFANLQVKASELLTNAANFLGFNIKEVEIIFDDSEITRYGFTEQEFVDCNCEDDIAKEIFKKAKIDNYFVNEINFMGIKYDEIDKVAKVNCQVCASNYVTYKKYINTIQACNVRILNSTNLYKLLKANKEQIELTIKIENNQAIACEYYGNKLNNVKVVDLRLNEIKQTLSNKFCINLDKVNEVLAIANQLASNVSDDVVVVNNYNLKTKSFNNVKASDVIALYRDEIRNQIYKFVDVRLFQSVSVVSDQPINNLEGFNFINNDDLMCEGVSQDKLVSLTNIGANKEINQFSFENKIKSIDLLA